MSRITLCLIAKDEESMLPGCLASVRGAVDEIVLVDTGSSDRTREIARDAGALVVERPWRDFSDARNAGLDVAKGEWVLVLDADERLARGGEVAIRRHAAQAPAPVGLLRCHDARDLDSTEAEILAGSARMGDPVWLPRLLQKTPDLRFEGVVHEQAQSWHARRGFRAARLDADIIHLGNVRELRKSRGKDARNIALLTERCRIESDDIAPFGFLALELLALGDIARAWEVAERGWGLLERQPPWRLWLRLAMARGLLALARGEPDVALECADRGERHDGEAADLHLLRGWALETKASVAPPAIRAGLLEAAAKSHRRAVSMEGESVLEQCVLGATQWIGWTRLGAVQLAQGRPAEALASFERALTYHADHLEALLGRAEAKLAVGDPRGALGSVEPLLAHAPDAWAIASLAAGALGAADDAALFMARALSASEPWVTTAWRDRAQALRAGSAAGGR